MSNDVNTAIGNAFGTLASNIANHIMHCLPDGAMASWIAYAYCNSWNSIYSDQWCRYYPSSQVRENWQNYIINTNPALTLVNNYYGTQFSFTRLVIILI
jgi:RNA polymerase subunit RPABC4/transcription elongation factor Spt4